MKTIKLSVLVLAVMILIPFLPVSGQNPDDYLKGWYKADFYGVFEGQKSYDIYYYKNVEVYESGVVYLRVLLVSTPFGRKNYNSVGLPTSDTYYAYVTYMISTTVDKYMLYSTRYIYEDGSMSETVKYPIVASSCITPAPGTVGDFYIKLARKLSLQKTAD